MLYADIAAMGNDDFPSISGKTVAHVLRANHLSLRHFAAVHNITLARTRALTQKGVPAGFQSWEFHRMIQMAIAPSNAVPS